jgi:hypothetical protein
MGYVGGELADLAPTLERGVRRFAQRPRTQKARSCVSGCAGTRR